MDMDRINLAPINVKESEQEVLCNFINDSNSLNEYVDRLKPIHFYNSSHRLIYQRVCDYYKKNKPCDLIVLQGELKGKVEFSVFEEIMNSFGHALETHVENIIKAYKVRELKRVLATMIQNLSKDNIDYQMESLESELIKLNQDESSSSYESLEDINYSLMEDIQEAYIKGNGQGYITGIKTGYHKLDQALGGLKKQQYYVMAARPSMGKSAFSLSLVNGINEQHKILYVQLDMTAKSMANRLLSMQTGISNRYLRRGQLTDKQWELMGVKGAPRKNLFIADTPGMKVSDIRKVARELSFKQGLDIIIIDHIGKIKPSNKGSIYEQMTLISNELKELARELDIVLICLSQLSRGVEQRADKRPMLSDLRDSGRIEEDADTIMMLYRDGYYKGREDRIQITDDVLEVHIHKNRDGLTGTVLFDYDLETQRIKEKFN